jgi:hypothetical protein
MPFYLDWTFWAVVVAALALVLSQLPPVHLLLKPRRLNVEVHSRIHVTHKVGNPNVSMHVSIANNGGRPLRIRGLRLLIGKDGEPLMALPAQNYFETPSSQASVLFAPFSLKPGEAWAHVVTFLNFFDRQTEKSYRENESALRFDVQDKFRGRAESDKQPVIADPSLVAPFRQLLERLFVWYPGEYVMELVVEAEPGSATYAKKYRFTLYESDTADLRKHAEDYQYGGGISYNVDRHIGLSVPIAEHKG